MSEPGVASLSPSAQAARQVVAAPPERNHVVQFYKNDAFLCEAVGTFLATALRNGEPILVIATPEHRLLFRGFLAKQGFDVDNVVKSGQATLLDARETISLFVKGSMPEAELFQCEIGGVIENILRTNKRGHLKVFGEMVDILWRDGNPECAISLEELWNDLAGTCSFSLICGYAMETFAKEAHWKDFNKVCDLHTHVVPTESFDCQANEDFRLREIAMLQQRAQSLETEISRRKELEAELRAALSDRERAEAEREKLLVREQAARQEAESASRYKDQFLAVLSHELRTPLTAILGWTHMVSLRKDQQILIRALDVIHRNATLQLHLVDDLLDMSRVMTGKMVITSARIDLAPLLSTAVDSVRPAAAAKSIQLNLQIDDSARFINGDAGRMQQIVWNLLANAIKFTPEKGRIDLGLERVNSQVRIVVQDNGLGIDPEFLPFVFDRFRQGDTGSTRKYGGLGLGLTVVRYLVEAHGGTVEVSSAGPGHGAVFTVSLPCASRNDR